MAASLLNKQKLKLLGLSIVPVLLICYKLAFTRTLEAYSEHRNHIQSQQVLDASFTSASMVAAKQGQINRFLSTFILDTADARKNLLFVVTSFCNENRLKLKEYKPLGTRMASGQKMVTRMVTVEGDFIKCLQFVYTLEKRMQVGRISSVYYKTFNNLKDHTIQLNCTIYVQNLVP